MIRLVDKLLNHYGEPRCWILYLTHHRCDLAYDDGAVNLTLNFAKIFLEDSRGSLIQDEVAKAPIIRVEERGSRHWLPDHFWNFGELLPTQSHILNFVHKGQCLIVEAYVEALGSVD